MGNPDTCRACSNPVLLVSSRLACDKCSCVVHVKCFRSTSEQLPTTLLGDTFFSLICSKCSTTEEDVIKRVKINWLTAITIALYNLSNANEVRSRNGFFHWKLHIAAYIDRNWSAILGPQMKKRKTWLGTISGTLSHWSGDIFKNGCRELSEPGWWALIDNRLPADLISDAIAAKAQGGTSLNKSSGAKVNYRLGDQAKEIQASDGSNLPKRTRGVQSSILSAMALKEKRATLSEAKDIRKQMQQTSPTVLTQNRQIKSENQKSRSGGSLSSSSSFVKSEPEDMVIKDHLFEPILPEFEEANFDSLDADVDDSVRTCSINNDTTNFEGKRELLYSENYFNEDEVNGKFAVGTVIKVDLPQSEAKPLTRHEEVQMLECLEESSSLTLRLKILKRKLKVRQQLRERHQPVFDFDAVVRKIARIEPSVRPMGHFSSNGSFLDRFQATSPYCTKPEGFMNMLVSRDPFILECMTSQYTLRMLKPFIRRSYKIQPPRLKLFEELLKKTRPNERFDRHPIDFLYFRPHHLSVINNMAAEFFWPGIDLSECLDYPDFSCVAVYGQLVIAFAFMVPDVTNTDFYISFVFTHPEWRRAGIAKFMIYHLCQSCDGKDITLHVPATSSAVLMYQKFGFKIEEYVTNFYDTYLPSTSTNCKHAFFMRLSQS